MAGLQGIESDKPNVGHPSIALGHVSHGDRLIFVGGPPRSGTTLVQNILDMHPEVIGAPEFLHLPDIMRMRRAMSENIERGWLEEYCTAGELDDSLRGFVAGLFEKLAGRATRYISEKTPQNVIYFADILEVFPTARFINVVRDPRAIVASLLQVYQRALEKGVTVYPDYTRDVFKAIDYTSWCLHRGAEFAKGHPERVHTLVYEQLVLEPEKATRGLCDFLGIPWCDDLLRPGSKSHPGESAITSNSGNIWYDKESYYRDPDRENLDKWTRTLSPADALLTARAFKNHGALAPFNYQFDDPRVSMTTRLKASLRTLSVDVRKALERRIAP